MISEYKKTDTSKILYIINDASLKYKGAIPDDCWHEPYMSEHELINEFNNGVHMYGHHNNNELIAVIGIQKIKDVILIRHAYTLTSHQGKGAGSALLEYLLNKNQNFRLLVALGKMLHGQFDFMKNLVSFFTQKRKQPYCLKKNTGTYHQNKLKIP